MMDYSAIPNPNNLAAEGRVYILPFPAKKLSWCGHAVDVTRFPNINCKQCWTFYFIHNVDLTRASEAQLLKGEESQLVHRLGNKFVKQLKSFLAAIEKANEVQKILEAEDAAQEVA